MKNLSRGLRKYIRKEKARVRREFLNTKERDKNLKLLYESLGKWYKAEFLDSKI